jgi:seryl-tRNA synthetase
MLSIRILHRLKSTVALKSALFIPGSQGSLVARTLMPEIDLDHHFSLGIENVRSNLKARKMSESDFNIKLEGLKNGSEYLRWIAEESAKITNERASAQEIYDILVKNDPKDDEQIETAKNDLIEIRKKSKSIMKERWDIEETIAMPSLRLPNFLHNDTPIGENDKEIHIGNVQKPLEALLKCHEDHPDVEFSNASPGAVFLQGQLVLDELELVEKAQRYLHDYSFDMIACPDMIRSATIEGCDAKAYGNPGETLCLKKTSDLGDLNSGLGSHLVGGASFPAMVSYFVKNIILNSDVMPINLMSIGRQYTPIIVEHKCRKSLYCGQQSSAIGILSLHPTEESMENIFDDLIEKVKVFYDKLGLHYRLVSVSASKLKTSQSFRLDIEMFSPLEQSHVTVGSLAKYGDFVSKRVMLKYYNKNAEMKSCHVIGGTFIDTTKVIGCIIEVVE